jgi:hypothetical protein
MTTWQAVGICGSLIVSALIVSWKGFFSAYGQKRGETLATKHDIDLVLEQLEKATKLTENIRSEISDKSIAKQRHKDIQRDAALDVMRIEGEFEQVLNSLFFLEQGMETAREKNNLTLLRTYNADFQKEYDSYVRTITKFWQARAMLGLVFSDAVVKKMGNVQTALSNVVNLLKGTDPLQEEVDEAERQRRRTHLKATQIHLREALRAELGFEVLRSDVCES